MKRIQMAVASLVAVFALSGNAHAQGWNKNHINNSGNGVNNTIQIQNRGPVLRPGFPPQYGQFGPGVQQFPQIQPQYQPQYQPNFQNGIPGVGPININVITNSFNGANNTGVIRNNSGPGGININVITNSANGINNYLQLKNR